MPKISQRGKEMPSSPIRRLAPLANEAKARGVKVYHLNIGQPDLPTPQKALDALKNIALENGAKVLDLQTVFNEVQKSVVPVELAIDGIHPTNLGHKIIAEAVEKIFEFK